MSNDKVKQEDAKAIHDLFCEFHFADNLGVIKSKLAEYVATVRREAFKEALSILNEFGRELRKVDFLAKLEAVAGINKRAELDRVLADAQIEDPVGVRLTELELERLDRLEASANSEKGEGRREKGMAKSQVVARKLTEPELNHLLELLESRKEEGSYFGPRGQYYARTDRLIQWCNEQLVDEKGEWR